MQAHRYVVDLEPAEGRPAVSSQKRASATAFDRLGDSGDVAASSPARALQQYLAHSLESGEPQRWSRRATLAFIMATCGGFWLLVGLGIARVWMR